MTNTAEPAVRVDNNAFNWRAIGAHLANSLLTLTIAYMTLVGTQGANNAKRDANELNALSNAYAQIEKQGKEIVGLREMLLDTQLQIVMLKSELNDTVTKSELLENFLNFLPFPAWIKRYDDERGLFIMYMINEQYTAKYGITRQQYLNRSDYDVYPPELAKEYEANDRIVMEGGKAVSSEETVMMSDGTTKTIVVYKFPMPVKDNEMGIGGASIEF